MTSKGIMRRARLLYVVSSLLFVVPRVFAQAPTSDQQQPGAFSPPPPSENQPDATQPQIPQPAPPSTTPQPQDQPPPPQ